MTHRSNSVIDMLNVIAGNPLVDARIRDRAWKLAFAIRWPWLGRALVDRGF